MDRDFINRHNIIERYLLGNLSDDEATAFEDVFAFDSELREELNVAEKLILGLNAINENKSESNIGTETISVSELDSAATDDNDEETTGTGNNRASFWLPLSLAANVLLGVGGAYWIFQYAQPENQVTPIYSIVNAPTITLEVTRSSQPEVATMPYNDGWTTLAISSATVDKRPKKLRIIDAQQSIVLEEEGFEIDPLDPWIEWLVKGSLLQPGAYQLELSPVHQKPNDNVVKIPFEICGATVPPLSACPN